MSEALIENLSAVRYPVEDKQEVLVILTKLELQAHMLLQESTEADAAIQDAEATLDSTRAEKEQLIKELQRQRKRQEDLKELSSFTESLKTPKAVMLDGREVIADLHHTRSEEQSLIENLEKEYESLLEEERELKKLWDRRYEAFSTVSEQVRDWALEYGFIKQNARWPKSRCVSNPGGNKDDDTDDNCAKENLDAGTGKESDIEMEIE